MLNFKFYKTGMTSMWETAIAEFLNSWIKKVLRINLLHTTIKSTFDHHNNTV
ncbi:MAG: hypothetical protein R6W68_02465 [Ignavibacteriaceae bacterium]